MKAVFAYATNYLIDTDHAVIVDVEATPAHPSAEVAATTEADKAVLKKLAKEAEPQRKRALIPSRRHVRLARAELCSINVPFSACVPPCHAKIAQTPRTA
jgi:hypothetical protein